MKIIIGVLVGIIVWQYLRNKVSIVVVVDTKQGTFVSGLRNKTILFVVAHNAQYIDTLMTSAHQHAASHVFVCGDASVAQARKAWPDLTRFDSATVLSKDVHNKCKELLASRMPPELDWILVANPNYEVVPANENQTIYDVNLMRVSTGTTEDHRPLLVHRKAFFTQCEFPIWTFDVLACSGSLGGGYYLGYYFHQQHPKDVRAASHDVHILTQWLYEVNAESWRSIALYYLAQAHEANKHPEKALDAYKNQMVIEKRSNFEYDATFRIAMIAMRDGEKHNTFPMLEVERLFMMAYLTHDGYFRREPLYYIAWMYARQRQYRKCIFYASAALSLPPVDYKRLPIALETSVYEDDTIKKCLDLCVKHL